MRVGTRAWPFLPRCSSPPSAAAMEKEPWPRPEAPRRNEGAEEVDEPGREGSRGCGMADVEVREKRGYRSAKMARLTTGSELRVACVRQTGSVTFGGWRSKEEGRGRRTTTTTGA